MSLQGKSGGAALGIDPIPATLEVHVYSEYRNIPRTLHAKGTNFHFQAKVEKQALEVGERMSNKPVDVIAEVYQKIRVPSDNIYKSKLVEIEIYKVSLLPSCPTL